MKYFLFTILILVSQLTTGQAFDYAQYVNPFIGTDGHGHTFPGATLPHGMVQLSPDTRIDGSWGGCSGYHYSDTVIYGFSHTHLSGTGVSDYGDIMLMPTIGEPEFNPEQYASSFSHQKESAGAGYYQVYLDKYNINVELTTTTRVGFHQYTFEKSGQANIILDLNHRDFLTEGEVRIIDAKTIEVKRRSRAWAEDQYVFARIESNKPIHLLKYETEQNLTPNQFVSKEGKRLIFAFGKKVKKGEKILLKVSLSFTGFKGAQKNSSEIKGWDFEKVKIEAKQIWNQELSKIEVTCGTLDRLKIFYTALYHTMLQPNIAQDVDGMYRGRDHQLYRAEGFDYYTVFSLWDTFRATHPLYTLIDKKRTADYVQTFIKQYEQGGRLPVWELASNETDCMIGYHSVSVIADAMMKDIGGFDYQKAFEASKHSAMLNHLGLEAYKQNGYIALEDEHESVSKTLEYAYDDWCIAQMALKLNHKEDYQYFMMRTQSWKNLFDAQSRFIRPRKNGNWSHPFDPREVNNNFTEGNAWQYTFFVPQDIPNMIEFYGGNILFEKKLDEMFNSESKTTGREQVDITGLIGQYAHGNEPSHHIAYLYNYIGKPEKTKEKVHYILNDFYKNNPDGLIGNEDCGQMGAWYVLSSMGLYSVCPGKPEWSVTEPLFDKIKVNLEDGTSKIITKNTPDNEKIHFGFENVTTTGSDIPYETLISVPIINADKRIFTDSLNISIVSDKKGAIYYSLKENPELSDFQLYNAPFHISTSAVVTTKIDTGDMQSKTARASFFKKPNPYTIAIKSTYNPQYHAGGPEGLIDGIRGSENWRKGDWQGFQSQDFEAVVDLQKVTPIRFISSSYLQDSRSWILMPTQVEYYVSTDNVHFEQVGILPHQVDPKITENVLQDFEKYFENLNGRYVKVIARNFGKLPEWHQGYPFGGEAFIFIDEITIN